MFKEDYLALLNIFEIDFNLFWAQKIFIELGLIIPIWILIEPFVRLLQNSL